MGNKDHVKIERLDGLWRMGDNYLYIRHHIDEVLDDRNEGPGEFDFEVRKIDPDGKDLHLGILCIFTNDIGTYDVVDGDLVMDVVANLDEAIEIEEPDLDSWGVDV